MSKKKRKHYQVYEGLRCAMTLCFISGYVNAFTYMTQGKRFAGVQTGNLLSFAIRLSEQQRGTAIFTSHDRFYAWAVLYLFHAPLGH